MISKIRINKRFNFKVQLEESFIIGDAVSLTVLTNETPTSLAISIKDGNNTVVASGAFTLVTENVYSYVFQSVENTHLVGPYIVTITSVISGKTNLFQTGFCLESKQ